MAEVCRPEDFRSLKRILRVLNSLIERDTSWLWMSEETSLKSNFMFDLIKCNMI